MIRKCQQAEREKMNRVENQDRVQNGTEQKEKPENVLPVQLEVRIHAINPNEVTKATASVNINGAFAIRGIRIVEGNNGLFVAMPSYKTADGYKDIVFPITSGSRQQLNEAVLDAYHQTVNNIVMKQQPMQRVPEGTPVEMADM